MIPLSLSGQVLFGARAAGAALPGAFFLATGIWSIKALVRIHSEWNDSEANKNYVNQRTQAIAGLALQIVGSIVFGMIACYVGGLLGKAAVLGVIDPKATIALLEAVFPAVLASGIAAVGGMHLIPDDAPNCLNS